MTAFLQGIAYNFKGLKFGLRNAKLLMLGLARLVIIIVITVAAAAMILVNYEQILNLMWTQPESAWVAWLWYVVSWLLALVLMAISALVGFLIAQLLFSVFIMDLMSQITERKPPARSARRTPRWGGLPISSTSCARRFRAQPSPCSSPCC